MKNYLPRRSEVYRNGCVKPCVETRMKSIWHCDDSLPWILNYPGNFNAVSLQNRRINGKALVARKVCTVVVRYWREQASGQLQHFPRILNWVWDGLYIGLNPRGVKYRAPYNANNITINNYLPEGPRSTRFLVHHLWVYWCCRQSCKMSQIWEIYLSKNNGRLG